MAPPDLQRFTGLSQDDIERPRELVVFHDAGDGVTELGPALSVAEAVALILRSADDAASLDNRQRITRFTEPEQLVFLAGVLDDHPALELVVAWEAQSADDDVAIGIFERLVS